MFASTNKKEPLILYNPNNPLNTTKKTKLSPNNTHPQKIQLTNIKNTQPEVIKWNKQKWVATGAANKKIHTIKLINTDNLKPHEHTNPKKIHEVRKSIIEEGIKYPIVADKKTNIILDGHHRHNVFKNLKIQKIPVFYVNYMDPKIILDSWNSYKLTKQDVINKATAGKVYPIKTTKHMLETPTGQTHISQTLPRINLDITRLIANTPTIKRL